MRMSAAGRARLTQFEGCVLVPYNDSQNHATIGIGHLIHLGPVTASDRATWAGFTRASADKLFVEDLVKYEAPVNELGVALNQNQFDACVSLCFNIGTGGFAGSEVARQIKARNFAAAANAFLNWSKPPELRPRREKERAWFLTPSPQEVDMTDEQLSRLIATLDAHEDARAKDIKLHDEEIREQLFKRLDAIEARLK